MKIFWIVCVALMTLPACSRIDIAYRWADTYIASKVDDYFDISSQQSRELKQSLQKDFEKMKSDVLPGWIDEAKKLEQDVANNRINERRVATLFGSIMMDVESLPANFSETAVRFISSANDKQLNYFAKYFHKKTQEEVDKFHNTKKFAKDYRAKYVKYFEMFLGDLTPEQNLALDNHIKRQPYPTQLKLENREWVLKQFMAQKGRPEALKQFVSQFAQDPQKFQLPEYKKSVKTYQADLEGLVVEIVLKMTAQQKKELRANLREKVAQLEKIRGRT